MAHRIPKFVLFFFVFGIVSLYSQGQSSKKIAILPFNSNGLDEASIQTAESILRLEISKQSTMDIISEKRTKEAFKDSPCSEADCALEVAKTLGATRLVGTQLSMLGEKIIVQFFVVDTDSGRAVLFDRLTSTNIEDLENVMKRIALSVVNLKPVSDNAQIGVITEGESKESLRRTSNKNFGISFGYLYPQDGYDNGDRFFVLDGRFDYELENYAIGLMLGFRGSFAMNIYGEYLFSPKDFCPYIGGAFGFHWITHSNNNVFYDVGPVYNPNRDKKGDGFELTFNTGMRILHTYNFQILVNIDFIITLNDYNDKAIVFTLGIL